MIECKGLCALLEATDAALKAANVAFTGWEKIGSGPRQRSGTWNSNSHVCYISVNFVSTGKKFKTLNLDIITTLDQGGQVVRKRAKGTIYTSHPNGKCFKATKKAS